jgi:hypothetical protein
MKKVMLLAAAAFSLAAAPAAGQAISQGMTAAQVQAQFGAPATTREAGEWTYWYYHNGCPVRCGSDDVVFFQNGRVVTAVLRTGRRHYAGPRADDALQATDDGTSAVRAGDRPAEGTVIVGGVRVEGGTPPRAGVIVVPAPADAEEGTPVPAREGRPGEPSMTVIQRSEANIVAPTTAEAGAAAEGEPAPAENTEATDTRGQTSIDRKNERNTRRNEETATERARRNDRRNP